MKRCVLVSACNLLIKHPDHCYKLDECDQISIDLVDFLLYTCNTCVSLEQNVVLSNAKLNMLVDINLTYKIKGHIVRYRAV